MPRPKKTMRYPDAITALVESADTAAAIKDALLIVEEFLVHRRFNRRRQKEIHDALEALLQRVSADNPARLLLRKMERSCDPDKPTDWAENLDYSQVWLELKRSQQGLSGAPAVAAQVKLRGIEDKWAGVQNHAGFSWPDTDVGVAGTGRNSPDFTLETGMLSRLGYHAGMSGESEAVRRSILDDVFVMKLPPVIPKADYAEWGKPQSQDRLKKMADCLATFARNFIRNDPDKYAVAISDWEADLAYLKGKYYRPAMRFGWPSTDGDNLGGNP